MNRRTAGLVALFLVLAACSSDPVAEPTTTTTTSTTIPVTTTAAAVGADEIQIGGTVQSYWIATGPLNPVLNGAWWDVLAGNAVNGVWEFDGNTGELVPDLVVELPSVANGGLTDNPDGTLTVRYEIRPDVVWSDGVPVTGDDFAFTHETVLDGIERAEAGEEFTFLVCDTPVPYGILDRQWAHREIVPGSLATGASSVEFTLTSPAAYDSGLFEKVLPKHAIEGTDFMTEWLDRPWPSAGPFVVDSFDRDASLLTLARNPEYQRTDATGRRLPYLDRVVFGQLPEFRDAVPDSFAYDDDGDPATAPVVVERLREFIETNRGGCGEDIAFDLMGIEGEREQALLSGASFQAVQSIAADLLEEGTIVEYPVFDLTRVDDLAAGGIEVAEVSNSIWEHLTFHYGDMRLTANPDSLVEHLEFRQAIAHALDRDRIAAEAPPIPGRRIDGIIEAFSPTFEAPELPYTYDPDRARELLGALCDRLDRDCEADPPRLRFDYDGNLQARPRLAEMVVEMLGEVGIVVDGGLRSLFGMMDSCDGWESSTWAWATQPGFATFATAYQVLDPNTPARNLEGPDQPYAWGTEAVEGIPDDPWVEFGAPPTPECDESLVYNQGPSSVRDEFTERYGELLEQLRTTVDRDAQLRIVNEMESIIADRVAFIPLYARPAAYAMRSDLVGGMGFAVRFGNEPQYWNLEGWYLKEPAG